MTRAVESAARCRHCASPLGSEETHCPACGGAQEVVSGASLYARHSRAIEADHALWRREWAETQALASQAMPASGFASTPQPPPTALPKGLVGSVHGMLNLLLLHGGFSPFRELAVSLPEGVHEARLNVSTTPDVLARSSVAIDPVSRRLKPPALAPQAQTFVAVEEAVPGTLVVELEADGRPVAEERFDLTVQPAGQWLDRPGSEAALVGAVTPNAAPVVEVLGSLGGDFIAYQDMNSQRMRRELERLYEAVGGLGLQYVSSAPSFDGRGQRILYPAELLRRRRGCCLDVVLLEAALLEGLGYRPLLLFFSDRARGLGHASTAVWTSEMAAQEAVLRDGHLLETLVGAGELMLWDSTHRFGLGGGLAAAETAGRGWLPHLAYALDLWACRRAGFRPLAGGWS